MTTLVAMDLAAPEEAANSSLVQSLKDSVLRDMRVLRASNAVVGQYSSYLSHVKADNPKVFRFLHLLIMVSGEFNKHPNVGFRCRAH